jgi:hypothetical protein
VREVADTHLPELVLRVAEHPPNGRVALESAALRVGENDADRRVFEDCSELRLFFEQFFEPAPLFYSLSSGGPGSSRRVLIGEISLFSVGFVAPHSKDRTKSIDSNQSEQRASDLVEAQAVTNSDREERFERGCAFRDVYAAEYGRRFDL